MVLTIKPKVTVVDYGPKSTLANGQVVTPDEFVWGASRITYKDIGTMEELRQAREEEKDISATVKKSLMKSAGSGHASMATTPAMWIMLEGNCSKMVDSAFTGYRFASSLMPSGRRIPIGLDQIVLPPYLVDEHEKWKYFNHLSELEQKKNEENEMRTSVVPIEIARRSDARNLYMKTSEANIQAYEKLQANGVPKEEAAKLVQYGHRGGGFMFMPLETVIGVVRDIKRNPGEYPTEIKEIALQLEDFARNSGMKVTYEARMAAPRTGCVNPNIFHSQINEAQEALDANENEVLYRPILQDLRFRHSPELERRVQNYLQRRQEVITSPEKIAKEGASLVHELQDIVSSYNNSFQATIAANIPWRVWGEDKRHRTMPLTTESIYHAVERAEKNLPYLNNLISSLPILQTIVSVPSSVVGNSENYQLWTERFTDSVKAYSELVKMGVPKGDALNVIPRGLKLGVVEVLDLYNATTGHNSLRLCKTAEREKRETTESYRDLLIHSDKLPSYLKELFVPKCNYVGFCFEDKHCGRINPAVPSYNTEMHSAISQARAAEMSSKI